MMRTLIALAALSLVACATTQATPPTESWQEAATSNDRERLRDWRTAFTQALEQARKTNAADVEREGVLVLSRQAGVFDELGAWAIGVDPLDVPGQADALAEAIALPVEERRRSVAAIREAVHARDLNDWVERELAELAERAPAPVA